ncbi:hypothetical protein CUU64_17030 [Bacillus sp. V5-8f]|nr:hypothetical protein CUU64_17030 [Bacillus sp. V5-8f]
MPLIIPMLIIIISLVLSHKIKKPKYVPLFFFLSFFCHNIYMTSQNVKFLPLFYWTIAFTMLSALTIIASRSLTKIARS